MHLIIRRLLKLFKTYKVVYTGQGVSNNQFYSGASGRNAWRVRAGIKDKYSKIFLILLLAAKIPKIAEYGLIVFYNSKMDTDNVLGGTVKLFADALKTKWVIDDSPKYCKFVVGAFDPTLPKNTTEFNIVVIK